MRAHRRAGSRQEIPWCRRVGAAAGLVQGAASSARAEHAHGCGRVARAASRASAGTRPRRAAAGPDWAARRGPRPDGADAGPAPRTHWPAGLRARPLPINRRPGPARQAQASPSIGPGYGSSHRLSSPPTTGKPVRPRPPGPGGSLPLPVRTQAPPTPGPRLTRAGSCAQKPWVPLARPAAAPGSGKAGAAGVKVHPPGGARVRSRFDYFLAGLTWATQVTPELVFASAPPVAAGGKGPGLPRTLRRCLLTIQSGRASPPFGSHVEPWRISGATDQSGSGTRSLGWTPWQRSRGQSLASRGRECVTCQEPHMREADSTTFL